MRVLITVLIITLSTRGVLHGCYMGLEGYCKGYWVARQEACATSRCYEIKPGHMQGKHPNLFKVIRRAVVCIQGNRKSNVGDSTGLRMRMSMGIMTLKIFMLLVLMLLILTVIIVVMPFRRIP